MNLSQFKLLKMDGDSYQVGHPSGRSIKILKQGLSPKAHQAIKMMADGGSVSDDAASTPIEDSPEAIQASAQDQPVASQESVPEAAPVERAPASAPATSSNAGFPGLSQQMTGTKALGEAEAKSGDAQSQAISEGSKIIDQLPTYQSVLDANKAKQAELESRISGQTVDPNRFWNNKSTAGKISANIGLLLSGIGAGVGRMQNTAFDMLNKQIDRDIDAQKTDQSKNLNLWKMNREALGSDLAANIQTREQALTAVKMKLQQAQASAIAPEARARAQMAVGQIQSQIDQQHFMMSALNPVAESGGGAAAGTEQAYANHINALKQVGAMGHAGMSEIAKDAESKYVPGVGVAAVPLRPEDKEDMETYTQLNKAIDDAKSFQQKVGTTLGLPASIKEAPYIGGLASLIPESQNNSIAQQKQDDIMLQLKKLYATKRLDEHSFEAYKTDVGNLGAIRSDKEIAKLDELKASIAQHKKATMQSLGIKPFKQSQVDSVAIQWAKQNPNDPRAAKIIQMNGAN